MGYHVTNVAFNAVQERTRGGDGAGSGSLHLDRVVEDAGGLQFVEADGNLGLGVRGTRISLPRENTSHPDAAAKYHGPETTRLVRERYAWAYEARLYAEPE
jgi:hypothetical protein